MNKLNINNSAFMFFKICKTCKWRYLCNFCLCSESFDNAYEYSHFRGGFFVIPYIKVFILNKWLVTKVKIYQKHKLLLFVPEFWYKLFYFIVNGQFTFLQFRILFKTSGPSLFDV